MYTSNFKSKADLEWYTRELAGITSSEFQINKVFNLESLISDNKAFQINYQKQNKQLQDKQSQDKQLQDE